MEESKMHDSASSHAEIAPLVFATYATNGEQLQQAFYLIESIRSFAGRFRDSPIWIFTPGGTIDIDSELREKCTALEAEFHISTAPPDALWFYYAGKVYAAGSAERMADGTAQVLVWMDIDTIVLNEPIDFQLPSDLAFAYRPVMHNRSGSAWDSRPDPFWGRIYEILRISDDQLFPMITPADRVEIRAYFNAGLLVVRPERGILRAWSKDFKSLYTDRVLADMCRQDVEKRIFIHQTALVGAVLNTLTRAEMRELSDLYNYPIFFERDYEATREFGSIEDVITLRYDQYFRNPDPNWDTKLKGPGDRIAWLVQRLGDE